MAKTQNDTAGRVSERPKGAANPAKPQADHQAPINTNGTAFPPLYDDPSDAFPPLDDDLSDAFGGRT